MSEVDKLIKLFAEQERYRSEQERLREKERAEHIKQMERLILSLQPSATNIPSFEAFDPLKELWKDYWARFETFTGAHSVPGRKIPQVFLTNQTSSTYKFLDTLASQQTPPKKANDLTIEEIEMFMGNQFNPSKFVVRERYKFWTGMKREPGETINQLAARIRQAATTCDFASIENPQDEAMRTRFICSVNNEAVLRALFRINDDELSFARAIEIACETEDAAQVAKETVCEKAPSPERTSQVFKLDRRKQKKHTEYHQQHATDKTSKVPKEKCRRCGKNNHTFKECRFANYICNFCQKKGHLQAVCLKKKRQVQCVFAKDEFVKEHVFTMKGRNPLLQQLTLNSQPFSFLIDSGSRDNFCSRAAWIKLGKPKLQLNDKRYCSATGDDIPTMGTFETEVKLKNSDIQRRVWFNVTKTHDLNLLGFEAIRDMKIDVTALLSKNFSSVQLITETTENHLQNECQLLCSEYSELFDPQLGCLKDVELEIKFKPDSEPIFCKPRTVPFAILEELNSVYDAGIRKGIWIPAQFNHYGTPVVPVRKRIQPNQKKAGLRICGDYSVTINSQLETHRYPMPLPEDLMKKLGGSFCFSKIDLADAYLQIKLAPESQRRLALSTHKGVLLQTRLPFGITSAPGYFQEIMDKLTCDLPGVAVYLDDILVSGTTADEHLRNLRNLLQRLQERGLKCNQRKCVFAQPSVEYLGH